MSSLEVADYRVSDVVDKGLLVRRLHQNALALDEATLPQAYNVVVPMGSSLVSIDFIANKCDSNARSCRVAHAAQV
jgi:hypothetical protein